MKLCSVWMEIFVNVEEREIAKKYNATLYLDEAHSIGVYGDNGGCAFW